MFSYWSDFFYTQANLHEELTSHAFKMKRLHVLKKCIASFIQAVYNCSTYFVKGSEGDEKRELWIPYVHVALARLIGSLIHQKFGEF